MKTIMKFSPGKVLSTGFVILAALAAATPQTQGSSCTPPPAGIVSWWAGEGNANDSIGTNNGTLVNGAGFTNGEVGQAFSFNGTSSHVTIPDSPSLDSFTNNITVETWIKVNHLTPNSDWEGIVTKGDYSWRLLATAGAKTVYFGATGASPLDVTGSRNVNDGQWHHVAATYDGTNMSLYVDGTLDVSHPASGSIIQTSDPVGLGYCANIPFNYSFDGLVDEVSLYNRALTASEIQAIYAAGSGGKCFTPSPPTIITQPVSQTNYAGTTASFSVTAGGTPPLSYQWSFDTTNIIGATNATLALVNVQLSQAGNYSVLVSNAYGSTKSATAVLTINPPPSCDPAPSGLVSWWAGEGNANDSIGINNGTLVGGAGFATGEVGQAFSFNGTSSHVTIPDSPSLDVFTNNITIELWLKVNHLTANSDWEGIVTKGAYSWRLQATPFAKTVDWALTGVTPLEMVGSRNVNDDQWHHVAAVYDGTNMSLYVDGTLDISQPASGLIAQTSDPLGLGYCANIPFNYSFDGLVDEVSVYHRALTASEIQAIYAAGSAGKCTATVPAVPAISSFTPAAGAIGTVVNISGSNFSANAASNIVYFGAVQAIVSSAAPTNLTVTVPSGATYAPITVTVNGLVAYGVAAFEPTFAGSGAAIDASTFAPGVNMNVSSPITTVIADLDGDGKPDLVVANVYANSISIYQNIGSNGVLNAASFAAPVVFPVGSGSNNPIGVTTADVDGDGKLDLLVADRNNNQIVVFRNISAGGTLTTNSFAPPVFLTVAADPRWVVVRDLDGDGRPDIVSANGSGSISILRNLGPAGSITTNSFAPRVDLALAGSSESVAVGDLDGDGKPDLAVADSSGFISLFRNNCTPGNISAGTFDARADLPAQSGSLNVVMGDLDGDGRPELIASAYLPQTMSVYRNLSTPGSLNTNSFAAPVDYALAGRGHTIALGDINGDGKPDIAEVTELASALSLFQNIGAGGFTNTSLATRVDYATGWNAWGVSVGDLDGDGRPDAVFGNVYDNTLTLYKNVIPFGTPASCTPPPSGLVGWWQGEGNANDSVGTNNGTLAGSGVTFVNGKVGQGFRLDGTNGYVQIPDSDALKPANVTCEAWVWLDPGLPSHNGAEQIVFKKNTWSAWFEGYSLIKATIDNGDGTYSDRFQFCVSRYGNQVAINSQTIAQRGVWYHVAATYDGNQSKLYVNSVLEASATPGFALDYDTTPIFIGTSGTWAPYLSMFGGIIDEVSIYNRALAANEIQAIYNAGSAGKCAILAAPVITTQPTNQTILAGDTANFSGAASGAQPLSYQWSFNGTNINGATNSILTLTNAQVSQAGSYVLLVTNNYGSAISSNAVLTVVVPAVPPTIISQTPSQVVLLGNAATFSVNASGSDPLSYFWKRDGAIIPGATNFIYTLNNAQLSDSGSKFSCLVTNAFGSAASTNATLKIIDTIANDLCSGAIIITNASYTNVQSTLKASAFGDPVPDCVDGFGHGVWYQFTAPVAGLLVVDTFGSDFDTGLAIYTGSCDALTEVACNDDTGGVTSQVTLPTTAGMTYFILAGGYSSDAGNLILHLNHLTPPAFAVQPADQSVVTGSNASFSATLTGAVPMNFQWYFNGTPLMDDGIHVAGSLTSSLILSNVTTADAGSYTLAVTNFLGSTNSTAAVLTVLVPATITTQPVGRSVPPGLPTTFNAAASGNPAPSYQWQLNGTNIPGATDSSYTITAVGTNDLGFYRLVASNSVGGAVSADAQLTFGPVAAWGFNTFGQCLPPPGLSNVISVAGGIGTSLAVRTDGTVVSWGSSVGTNVPASASNVVAVAATGQVGNFALRADGTVVSWAGPIPPALSNVVSVAAGFNFGMALRAEGTVVGWGNPPFATVPAGLNHVKAVACGFTHSLALRSDGTVFAWGNNVYGQTNVPAGLTNVTAIAAGYMHSLALKADGTVVAWGSGSGTNLPAGLTNITAISTEHPLPNSLNLALRANGTVVTWGESPYGETNPPAALNNLLSVAIAAAPNHGLALVNDGSPVILHPPIGLTAYTGRDVTLHGDAAGAQPLSYQWLLNGTNVPGATNTSLVISNVQFSNAGNYQLSVSNSINTALSLAAPLNVISNNTLMFLSVPASQTNYQGSKVSFGVTVLGNGPLRYQWFFSPTNKNYTAVPGATNDMLVLDPALAINTGNYYVAVSNLVSGITNTPTFLRVLFAKSWGYLATDPPFDATNATAIAVGNFGLGNSSGHYLVLKADGKIASWTGSLSYPNYGQTNFATLSNSIVTAIAAGYGDSLALKSDGTVYAVGYGIYGETNVPSGLSGVTAIACGDYHDLALKLDGTVAGWGQNTYLQTTNVSATNVVAIAAGGRDSIALRADGSVVIWGQYGNGQYLIPFNATNIIAVAAGGTHFLALRANGTVVGWGNYSPGQVTIPATWSNIVAISAGANHSVALRNDGTILTLGNYYNGPTLTPGSVPPDLANVIAIASSGDHDLGLFGTRAPAFTVQPWNRTVFNTTTSVWFAAKCAGVQPMSYQWRLNGTNLPAATNDTLTVTGSYLSSPAQFPPFFGFLPIPAGNYQYQLIASNAYGVAVSKPAKLAVLIPLGNAVDATNLNWTTTGNAQWFGETNVTHDGVDAARSGGIGALQETILQTTVGTNWSGRYTFWWKVSSEQFFDILEFRVNGTVQTSISGEVNWQQASIPVAAGTNLLQWRYSKDVSFDAGLDAGFVDQFAFVPDGPLITLQPVSQIVNMGTNVTFRVTATGQPRSQLIYQWRQNGNLFSGGGGPLLNLNNVGRAQNGTYFVTVTDVINGGSTVSSNAVLKVLVPQLLGSPVLLPDGSFQLTSTDANGGLLSPSDLANFEAQASTDLVNWVTLPNALSLTNGMLQLQDSAQSNFTARYYRIIEH
jgi:alpha-tubulin suppressor-like RCC1 family protein